MNAIVSEYHSEKNLPCESKNLSHMYVASRHVIYVLVIVTPLTSTVPYLFINGEMFNDDEDLDRFFLQYSMTSKKH